MLLNFCFFASPHRWMCTTLCVFTSNALIVVKIMLLGLIIGYDFTHFKYWT